MRSNSLVRVERTIRCPITCIQRNHTAEHTATDSLWRQVCMIRRGVPHFLGRYSCTGYVLRICTLRILILNYAHCTLICHRKTTAVTAGSYLSPQIHSVFNVHAALNFCTCFICSCRTVKYIFFVRYLCFGIFW